VTHPALGDKSKIYLSALPIMLGLIKVSVRATDKESEMIAYFRQTFPKISEIKKKKGILVGSQITQLFEDHVFSTELNSAEKIPCKAFENVCRIFIAKEKA
jgi:hypothetical protein